MLRQFIKSIAFFLILNSPAFSGDITIVGDLEQTINLNHTPPAMHAHSDIKHITLLEVELSDKAQSRIYQRIESTLKQNTDVAHPVSSLSKQKQLGMNNVPVLDQGQHGACVTFAVTAAIDAELNKGDYVSQLCLLQLGRYLEHQGLESSGWEGSNGRIILNRIDKFGIINQEDQQNYGCGGIKKYPLYTTPYTEMTIEEYEQYHEMLSKNEMSWKLLFSVFRIFNPFQDTVKDVKAALNANNRVAVGVLLPRADLGEGGATATYHIASDTWVLTDEIAEEVRSTHNIGGHEMVITGYDDDAVAIDTSGNSHYGLFTLRNSWGPYAADKGNFYMSYEYFNALALDAYQIGKG